MSSPREKQCFEGKDEHFAPAGCAEGVEEAGRLCCLMPVIPLSVEASQDGSGREWEQMKRLYFLYALPGRLNPSFFFSMSLCLHREHGFHDSDDKLRYINHAAEMGTQNFAPHLMTPRHQDH